MPSYTPSGMEVPAARYLNPSLLLSLSPRVGTKRTLW